MSDVKMGRPLLFKTVEELEIKIQEYFDTCFEEYWIDEVQRSPQGKLKMVKDKISGKKVPATKPIKRIKVIRPLTISGLAYHLGTNRERLLQYEKKEDFHDTIQQAKERIRTWAEEMLYDDNVKSASAIFNLKANWRFQDKQVIEHKGAVPISLSEEGDKRLGKYKPKPKKQ